MKERFNAIVKKTDFTEYTNRRFCCGGDYCQGDHNGWIKDFIQSEIELAKKKERKRIVEMIDSHVISLEANNAVHKIFGEGYTKARKDFINLITNNK